MFKVITGQRDQLERKLIEEICIGDLKKADELVVPEKTLFSGTTK